MISAACVLIQREDGLCLALSRRNDYTKFGLVGGKLDPHESYEAAACREAFEETGLVYKPDQLRRVFASVFQGFDVVTFEADCPPDPKIITEVGVVHRWMTKEELSDPNISPFGEYNRALFSSL